MGSKHLGGIATLAALSLALGAGQASARQAPSTSAAPVRAAAATPGWSYALAVRSDGLNRVYHLGRYTPESRRAQPQWLVALAARSAAQNVRHGLPR